MDNDRIEHHHVGGRLYGRLVIELSRGMHHGLTQAQAPYSHLLRRPGLPVSIAAAVVLKDVAALLELIARELRRLADLLLGPYTWTRGGRMLLTHPNAKKRRAP
jgi:hypothetical protein